jgi:ribosomal protein L40E
MTALLVGTALAVASLCYVLYPLFRGDAPTVPHASSVTRRPESPPVCERCGPTTESDAEFCSRCGSRLVG